MEVMTLLVQRTSVMMEFFRCKERVLILLILQVFLAIAVEDQEDRVIFPDNFDPLTQNYQPIRPFPTLPRPQPPAIQYSFSNVIPPSSFSQARPVQTTPHSTQTGEDFYWKKHVNDLIARGVTKFGLDVNRAIVAIQKSSMMAPDAENVVFSPISLVETLAMVLLGSAGKTFDEVVKIIGFESGIDVSAHSEIVHRMFGLLLESLDKKGQSGPEIYSAEGIFIQEDYPIRSEFSKMSLAVYHNEVLRLDFLRNAPRAKNVINDWVTTMTRGKITNLLPEPPSSDTKVIFASTLYFNAEWNKHFQESATRRRPFNLSSGQTVTVDMMFNGGEFPFYEDQQLGVKILALPYKNSLDNPVDSTNFSEFEATMYLLLPTSTDPMALANVQSKLTPEKVDELISRLKNECCIIAVPKMKLSSSLNLNRVLYSMGLTSLFVPDDANLAMLSPGLNEDSVTPLLFSRNGESNETTEPTAKDFHAKDGYFRYEDQKGGYVIQQWKNGVYIRNISGGNSSRKAKRSNAPPKDPSRYFSSLDQNSTSQEDVKVVKLEENKYKFRKTEANIRQRRWIDNAFGEYIEKRRFKSFGLDTLRNSGTLPNPGLFASEVLHKVEIDITETGTVAAASTSFSLQRSGDQKRFVADRPFSFFIRHNPSKLILFQGTINKPTPNYP